MEAWDRSLVGLVGAVDEDDFLGVETIIQNTKEGEDRFALLWSPSMPQGMTALQYALERGCSIELIKALLQSGATTEPASEGPDGFSESALWMCVRLRRSLEIVALLLDFKADVYFTHWLPAADILPETQYGLLHFLSVRGTGHSEWTEGFARVLIRATGACLINEARNNRQDTPLILCCRMNGAIPRAFLESAHLDLLLRDCNGQSAYEHAARNRNISNCIALECCWLNACFRSPGIVSYGRIRRKLRGFHERDDCIAEMFVGTSETAWCDVFGIEADPEEVPLDALWEWDGAMEAVENADWHLSANVWFKRSVETGSLFFRLRKRREGLFESRAFQEALQLSASGEEKLVKDEYQPTTATLCYFEQALEKMALAVADKRIDLEQRKAMQDYTERILRRLVSLRAGLVCDTAPESVSSQQDAHRARQSDVKRPWWRRLFRIRLRQANSQPQGEHCCPVCSAVLAASELNLHVSKCIDEAQPTGRHYTIIHIPKPENDSKPCSECPICYEDMKPSDRIALLDCLCHFHEGCIEAWFFRESSGIRGCPVHESR